jgi:DNA recombination protein RmuC
MAALTLAAGACVPPIDPFSLVLGLLLALLLAAPLALWAVRTWHLRGRAAGRTERDPELAALAAERTGLRADLDAAGDQLRQQAALVDQLRAVGERLGNERSALLVRAERVGTLEHELDQARAGRDGAQRQVAELSARLDEQQRAAGERLRELEGARERMKTEFQALAAQILDDKVRRLGEHSGEQLGQLLTPLREQLDGFRKAVSDAYEKESGARIALQTEVRQLLELNHKLGAEANSLTRALTSDSRSQGYWGEIKLERLLELAGLERGREYLTQESFRDADGDLYRPDAVLKLPGGRDIVIDAKVNLTDYQRACDEVDADQRERHLGQHVAAMRRHVLQLGKKDYSRLDGLSSPELVFMFVPVEGAFLEALRRDSALYDDAFRNRIIPVGPSNLLASLSLVAQVWRTEEQNRNAQLIAERAGGLYDKLVGFVEDMAKVGDALDRAQKTHQSALGKLAQGKGNLIRRAEQLRGLGVAPGKRLPANLLDLSGVDEGDAAAGAQAMARDDEDTGGDATASTDGPRPIG